MELEKDSVREEIRDCDPPPDIGSVHRQGGLSDGYHWKYGKGKTTYLTDHIKNADNFDGRSSKTERYCSTRSSLLRSSFVLLFSVFQA